MIFRRKNHELHPDETVLLSVQPRVHPLLLLLNIAVPFFLFIVLFGDRFAPQGWVSWPALFLRFTPIWIILAGSVSYMLFIRLQPPIVLTSQRVIASDGREIALPKIRALKMSFFNLILRTGKDRETLVLRNLPHPRKFKSAIKEQIS